MGKVIQFPNGRTDPVQQEVSDFYENEITKAYIEDFVDKIGHGLVNELHNNGYDVDDEEFIVRFMYSLEMMKSVLYYNKGIKHQLEDFVSKHSRRYFENEVTENDE
jgi:hypothetical protein